MINWTLVNHVEILGSGIYYYFFSQKYEKNIQYGKVIFVIVTINKSIFFHPPLFDQYILMQNGVNSGQ